MHLWTKRGLPRTEWTGESLHAAIIERLCRENGHPEFTRDRLLLRRGTEGA